MAKRKKVRVVMVGCGGMASAWMTVALKLRDVEMVGLVDIRRPAAEALADRYGLPRDIIHATLSDALRKAKPDAVFDVTVPAAHDKVTNAALRAGCHVMGEKPMSDSLAKARRMVAEADKAKRLYAVIQNRRYEPNIQRTRKIIAAGKIGIVEEVHSDFYIGAHFGGFRDEMDDPLIVDMAIHTFDAARYISAADPVSVYCHSFNPPHSWYRGDASAVAVFEMADAKRNRIVYSYRGSWCSEGMNNSWNSDWRVVGSKGSLTWDGADDIRAQAIQPRGKHAFTSQLLDIKPPTVVVKHQGHDGLIREFVRCVQTGAKPQTECHDNIKSLAMVLAAVRSARTGRKVKVEW